MVSRWFRISFAENALRRFAAERGISPDSLHAPDAVALSIAFYRSMRAQHALIGNEHGHDDTWRDSVCSIGYTGQRCVAPESRRVEGGWVGTCPAGHRITRPIRSMRVASCSECPPRRFDPRFVFTWTHRGQAALMHLNYLSELRTLTTGTPGPDQLAPGTTVRVSAPGPYAGVVGRIQRRAGPGFRSGSTRPDDRPTVR